MGYGYGNIVQEIVTQQVGPTPNLLQQTGAFISEGATQLKPGSYSLLTQLSDLTPLLTSVHYGLAITSAVYSSVTLAVTVQTTVPHGFDIGTTPYLTLAGFTPSGYNGAWLCTITTANQFTFLPGSSLAATSVVGTYSQNLILSATWASNLVTVTTSSPHGLTAADTPILTIASMLPAGYNGTFTCTVTGTTTFTYPLTTNPGSATQFGVWIEEDVAELYAMATTFFAQGATQSVYVLEVGPLGSTDAIAYLTSWLITNPGFFYGFLVPRDWANQITFYGSGGLLASYQSPSSKLYFWVTMTTGNYTNFTNLQKDVVGLIEAPGVAGTNEFSLAACFYVALNYKPNVTNQVTPYSFSFVYGVTPYPTMGNGALFATLKAAAVNIIATGAEGGISNTIIMWGTMMDGNPLNYWYAIDWMALACDLALANAVINSSNNPTNPLYYNQQGINTLQGALVDVVSSGNSFGLVLFPPTQTSLYGTPFSIALEQDTYSGYSIINAVPFIPYNKLNPSAYKAGSYGGFSITFTPLRGFENITLNITATQFIA
jgi:hypothetical protein